MLSEVLVRHVLPQDLLLKAMQVIWVLLNSLANVGVDHVACQIIRVVARLLLRLVVVERALLVEYSVLLAILADILPDIESVSVILLARQVVEFVEFRKDEVFSGI